MDEAHWRTLAEALPPTDHVARALLQRGATDAALTFLKGAVARDPKEKACAALLRAVEARPAAPVSGPELDLDMALVGAFTRSSMFVEALAVLHGAKLTANQEGRAQAEMLKELLAPPPKEVPPELGGVAKDLRTGRAVVALANLDQRAAAGPMGPWASRCRQLLHALLMDAAVSAPAAHRDTGPATTPLGAALGGPIGARDMAGALEAARALAAQDPADMEVRETVSALDRLISSLAGELPPAPNPHKTEPMRGVKVAFLQFAMGNLAECERLLRRELLKGGDDRVRGWLADAQVVQRALAGEPVLIEQAAPVDALSSTQASESGARQASQGGEELTRQVSAADILAADPLAKKGAYAQQSGVHEAGPPLAGGADWDDEPTSVGSPEHHAELCAEKGDYAQAKAVYDMLVEQRPDEPDLRERARQLADLVGAQQAAAQAAVPASDAQERTASRARPGGPSVTICPIISVG